MHKISIKHHPKILKELWVVARPYPSCETQAVDSTSALCPPSLSVDRGRLRTPPTRSIEGVDCSVTFDPRIRPYGPRHPPLETVLPVDRRALCRMQLLSLAAPTGGPAPTPWSRLHPLPVFVRVPQSHPAPSLPSFSSRPSLPLFPSPRK